jgi:TonB-linked SusC/RagA family outer membrane protein
VLRDAPIQNHQLSVIGGNDKTQLALSANYFNQDGVIINNNFKRYSLRANIDHTISDRFRVGTSILGSFSVNKAIPTGSTSLDGPAVTTSIVGAAIAAPPTLQPYDANGNIFPFADQLNGRYREVANPLGLAAIMNQTNIKRILANVYGEVNIINGLTYRASFNVISQNDLNDFYSPIYIIALRDRNANSGSAAKTDRDASTLLHESILTYSRLFAQQHSLKFTGVFSTQSNEFKSNTINTNGFPNDATINEALQLGTTTTVNSNRTKERLDSYMGRINYGFRDKYFLDLTARADGVSKFGSNFKYGFFPAIAAAWRVAEESFMENLTFINDFKIRASYGLTGNAGAIDPYRSLATIGPGAIAPFNSYIFNHIYTTGLSPTGISNPDLRWEKSIQTDIGIDISVLKNKVNLTVDAYHKKTKDLLYVKRLPLTSGYTTLTGNFAELENKGIELSTNINLMDKGVRWDISGNITFNRNKVLSLDEGVTTETFVTPFTVLRVGQPLGVFKTLVFDGIYQADEASAGRPGSTKVKEGGQMITGNPNPDFIFGFSTNVAYKNFDLNAFFSGTYGNDIYNVSRYTLENPLGNRNVVQGLANRWSDTNPNNEYVSGFQGGRLPISDRFVEDGSYLRCKNITLGYTLPKINGIYKIRVYASANNLFTVTNYTGFDPEVNSYGGSNTAIGIDNLVYPVAKSYLGGLQLTF